MSNSFFKYFFVLFFLMVVQLKAIAAQSAGSVLFEAKVDRNKITIGDLIRYSIIVTSDEDVEIQMPTLGANLGAFEIRDYDDPDPVKKDGKIVQRREYTISTYDVGDYQIPPVTVRYTPAGDSVYKELSTESIKITVLSLKPSEEGDIRDIKPPLVMERDWWRTIRFALAGLVAVGIIILTLIYLKRRREGKALIPRREKPKRPPHQVALEALENLVQEKLLEQGEIKQYYIQISDIIRRYIEDRYFINAPEMTTGQLIEALQHAELEEQTINMVERFLMQCDLVKFAKYIPTEPENQQTTTLAFEIVETTKIIFELELDEPQPDDGAESFENGETTSPADQVEVVADSETGKEER
ncbi:MAG: BatD family protein [bacterium]|nr:BatD family protein [bacterium]